MGVIITEGRLGGIQATLWLRNHSLLKQLVKEMGLARSTQGELSEHLTAMWIGTQERAEAAAPLLKRPPIPGGIRVPHLHVDGDLYVLDEKQWKEISARLIKEFQAKLSRVNAVSFEQTVNISEAVDVLAVEKH